MNEALDVVVVAAGEFVIQETGEKGVVGKIVLGGLGEKGGECPGRMIEEDFFQFLFQRERLGRSHGFTSDEFG